MITQDELQWMLNHWWVFAILILGILWLFWLVYTAPEDKGQFSDDFNSDFKKKSDEEEEDY